MKSTSSLSCSVKSFFCGSIIVSLLIALAVLSTFLVLSKNSGNSDDDKSTTKGETSTETLTTTETSEIETTEIKTTIAGTQTSTEAQSTTSSRPPLTEDELIRNRTLTFVTRAEWGAQNPTEELEVYEDLPRAVVIIHTVTPQCFTKVHSLDFI